MSLTPAMMHPERMLEIIKELEAERDRLAGEVERLQEDYGLLCDTLRDDRAAHAKVLLDVMDAEKEIKRLMAHCMTLEEALKDSNAERDRLAGEVERWRNNTDNKDMHIADLEVERDRLKAALEGIARNADVAADLPLFRVQCRDFARKALGKALGDAS